MEKSNLKIIDTLKKETNDEAANVEIYDEYPLEEDEGGNSPRTVGASSCSP